MFDINVKKEIFVLNKNDNMYINFQNRWLQKMQINSEWKFNLLCLQGGLFDQSFIFLKYKL